MTGAIFIAVVLAVAWYLDRADRRRIERHAAPPDELADRRARRRSA